MLVSAGPSTNKTCSALSYSNNFFLITNSSSPLISHIYWLTFLIPADIAIHFAVYTLSPVNIHIFMPPILKASIVAATSSCNLSYTPVMPIKSIYFYSFSMIYLVFWCRFFNKFNAYSYYLFHSSNYCSDNSFWVITNVRSPSLANVSH